MPLHKITKQSVKGCLLVQFKYEENEGEWTHASGSNVFATVNNKNITLTPQYPTSIIEFSCSFTIRGSQSSTNSSHTFESRLLANGQEEHLVVDVAGFEPHGNNHSHTGGRNDRTAPTRRHGHVTNSAYSSGFTHAFIPRATNAVILEVQARSTTDMDFIVADLFMIAKEIGIPEDRVAGGSGSITHDGV
tara:strand:- start:1172 stop:1741 length:570 start_codon:yes stop_codon:yes gene_type:complete